MEAKHKDLEQDVKAVLANALLKTSNSAHTDEDGSNADFKAKLIAATKEKDDVD